MDVKNIKNSLRQLSAVNGGKLFGVCDIGDLADSFHPEIRKPAHKLNRAISVGLPVSKTVLDTLTTRPNMLYKTHYRNINHILNDIALLLSQEIGELGHRAIPVPASQILEWKPMKAHLSHRVIAYRAGLGWPGKNNLLVNKKYGSQVRLVTVLTDLGLETDKPVKDSCNDCQACVGACPVNAIGKTPEDFDLEKCFKKVAEFARPENIGSYICGLCLKVCPGKMKIKES